MQTKKCVQRAKIKENLNQKVDFAKKQNIRKESVLRLFSKLKEIRSSFSIFSNVPFWAKLFRFTT